MIRCEGHDARGLVHIWEPSWERPRIIDFGAYIPGGKIIGKTIVRWLNVDSAFPAMFFSDSKDYLLCSLSTEEDGDLPWQAAESKGVSIHSEGGESPLELIPTPEKRQFRKVAVEETIEDYKIEDMSSGSEEMDDTFLFKKIVEPKGSSNSSNPNVPWGRNPLDLNPWT